MVRRTRDGAVDRQWRLQYCQNLHLDSSRGRLTRQAMLLQAARRMKGKLTENCTGRIVTGETGLAHTRTSDCQLMVLLLSVPIALLRRTRGGFARAWAQAMQIAPPQQGWLELWIGGMSSPIVDDEGCDFLCS